MATYDITALSTALEFESGFGNFDQGSVVRVGTLDRVLVAWGNNSSLWLQAFNINKSTGVITAIGSRLEGFDSFTSFGGVSLVAIDDSNYAVFWADGSSDGRARLFSLDGTGNVSTNGSAIEYDTTQGTEPTAVLMDSTHILNVWRGTSLDGFAAIFTVDTGAGTITLTGTPFEFDTTDYRFGSLAKINDTKAVLFYSGIATDGYAVVLNVNTSTWAVTAAGSVLEYLNNSTINSNSVVVMDNVSSPFRVINNYIDATAGDAEVQSFSINTSTFAITNLDTPLDLSTSDAVSEYASSIQKVDDTHIVAFYQGAGFDGFARVVTYNVSTGALSATANEIEFETSDFFRSASADVGGGYYVCIWRGVSQDGFIQAFQVELPVTTNTTNFFHLM
jgi:hypothetical protein